MHGAHGRRTGDRAACEKLEDVDARHPGEDEKRKHGQRRQVGGDVAGYTSDALHSELPMESELADIMQAAYPGAGPLRNLCRLHAPRRERHPPQHVTTMRWRGRTTERNPSDRP